MVVALAILLWTRTLTPDLDRDQSFWLLVPVLLVLPIIVIVIFSQYRQNKYFDTLFPLVVLISFFLSMEHGHQWERWGLILFSVVTVILFRLVVSPIAPRFSWRRFYVVMLVFCAVGMSLVYVLDHHLVPNIPTVSKIFTAFFAVVGIPYFILSLLSVPQALLLLFPIYVYGHLKMSTREKRYDLILASVSFVALAFSLLPLYAMYMRAFHDPCYMRGTTYSPKFHLLSDKKMVCVTSSSADGSYGETVFHALAGADYNSFQDLGQLYAKDRNSVYFWENVVNADPESFRVLPNYGFASDKDGLLYKGKRADETTTYVNKEKGFQLQFPKEVDKYPHDYDVFAYPIRFEVGPNGERCHGEGYSHGGTQNLVYSVQVFWPKNCWVEHGYTFVSKVDIDGTKGARLLSDDGYEEMMFVRGDSRYFIRKKGDWHEQLIPKFSFVPF